MWWIAVSVGVAVVALLAILLLPRTRNAADGPLPPEIETRILLGETPDKIETASNPGDVAPESRSSDADPDH